MWSLLQQLMADEALKDFVLVGGTALSLKMGHRKSIDIDLFTDRDFDAPSILEHLEEHYGAERGRYLRNSVFSFINRVKVDIVSHQYPFQKPIETIEGIRMASNEDIGAMKLHAIVQSGSRLKDFIDMFFLLEQLPLIAFMNAYENKYPNTNAYIAQLGLTYHQNIDFDEKVDLLVNRRIAWDDVANRLRQAVISPYQKFTEDKRNKIEQGSKMDRGKGYGR
ncbi:nucleotidyl transferase AbiEii/AbiGii toxin family protein [Olivibacter sp. XZL3]|uniref:nucleotidyl transferase AbiEii/AbiGii toxin family protein n=1 Tax=Olivibacter sp. XZL3 TaxID=1735116 RepID=UPI00197DDB71|nr:nucleotidyl transferase AbiEii/AbiGii toxin family protein [Olivibacter sp. XZL3]